MARKIYGARDFSDNELLNILIQMLPSDPTGVEAKLYYNTTAHELRYHDGTSWKALGTAGAGGPPSGAAGGDLTGSYPSPQIAAGVIMDADVNNGAAIQQSKIANLTTDLAAKAPNSALANYQLLSAKGQPSGYAPLDASALIPTAHLPPLAINEVFTVASEAAMLALVAQRGDMAIRTDNGLTYVLATDDPTLAVNWKQVTAAGQVVSVNGKTGVVTITLAELGGVPTARQVVAGAGLTGGGDLSADRTLNVVGDANLSVQPDVINVLSAPKWTTPRSIALTGDVTGSAATVDGSANVSIATTLAAGAGGKRYAAALTASTSQVVTHNLGTQDVHVTVYSTSTPFAEVDVEVEHTSINTITIKANPALPAGMRVVVLG